MYRTAFALCLALGLLSACPPGPGIDDDGGADAGLAGDAGDVDAGSSDVDAGDPGVDAGGPGLDGGVVDGGRGDENDAGDGNGDAGPPLDGGEESDAGEAPLFDAGPPSAEAFAYWQDIGDELSGQALVQALHSQLTSTHETVSYGDVLAAFESTDDDRGGCNGIFDFYSANCWSASEACGQYNSEGDCYNREHSWPKSWWGGGTSNPAYSDLFHVIPADGYVNNQRSNWPLDEVTSSSYTSSNGSRVGPCASVESFDPCFEPTDAVKGDLARIYFYMAVRYEGQLGSSNENGVVGADLKLWMESVLRQWHLEDPVDQDERDRNEAVFVLQQNRNPFVDFPSWVSRIDDY